MSSTEAERCFEAGELPAIGYTRIVKFGPRKGDGAPISLIELLADGATAEETSTTGRGFRHSTG